jgi:hypothetical protein
MRDGRLAVFARGFEDGIWDLSQLTPGGGWSSWSSRVATVLAGPTIGINADGRLELFALRADQATWHDWQ